MRWAVCSFLFFLGTSSLGSAAVTVNFDYDPSLVGGADQIAWVGTFHLNFEVDNDGVVTLDVLLNTGIEPGYELYYGKAATIADSWGGVVGTVDPSFAGAEFRLLLQSGREPVSAYSGDYEEFFVLGNRGGSSGHLGISMVNTTELDAVHQQAAQVFNDEDFQNYMDAYMTEFIVDPMDGTLNWPDTPIMGDDSEQIYIGIDGFGFGVEHTAVHFQSLSYENASGSRPNFLLRTEDLSPVETTLDLSGPTSGVIDITDGNYWSHDYLRDAVGFDHFEIAVETETENSSASSTDTAGLSSFTFDLIPYYEGDLNRDQKVDPLDFEFFAAGWGTDTTGMDYYDALLLGDVNWDSIVDWEDLMLVRQSFEDYGGYQGDLNCDSVIDQADRDLFLAGFDSDTTGMDYHDALLLGDVNWDGIVNWDDWYLIRDSFEENGVSVVSSLSFLVPEPSTLLLVGCGLMWSLVRAQRHNRL